MAITSPLLKLSYRYNLQDQQCQNVQYWDVSGSIALLVPMVDLLEAHWNDVKAALRGLVTAGYAAPVWESIYGEEVGGSLEYAEYSIPVGERQGTRTDTGTSPLVATFNAGGFRQTVGSRTTRPGQKRFPFITEADMAGNDLTAGYLTALEAVAVKFSTPSILGAPAALVTMQPVITSLGVGGLGPLVYQDVTGYVMNNYVTSQVSRKRGHGS